MNPSVDDRLASIIRSLTDLIVPALPPDAGLAQEQAYLAIGHLKILRAQFDSIPAFEIDELADTRALAVALLSREGEGPGTRAAQEALRAALERPANGEHARITRIGINRAIDAVIREMPVDGGAAYRTFAATTLVDMESRRVIKDRKWFAPMGFDTDILERVPT